jgi:hypothetical protein
MWLKVAVGVVTGLFVLGIIGAAVAGQSSGSTSSSSANSNNNQSTPSQATKQLGGNTTLWDWSQMDYNQQMQVIHRTLQERGESARNNVDYQKGLYLHLQAYTEGPSAGGYGSWSIDETIGAIEVQCALVPSCPIQPV